MAPTSFPEFDVLYATVAWLLEKSWRIDTVSILHSREKEKAEVRRLLQTAGWSLDDSGFRPHGPDIIAGSDGGTWKFECKGLITGDSRTHRNQFDRGVAGVVSYYDAPDVRLGLSIPDGYLFKYNFGDRLPRTLREATNLWVFLYSPQARTVHPFEPWVELPYRGALD